MNRFPLWKYILIGVMLVVAFLYALPKFFGEVPAVQVSPVRTTEKVDAALLGQVESLLKAANVAYSEVELAGNSIKTRFASTDVQIKAKDVLQNGLGERYTVALNLVSASPAWLSTINALPMYLGLDLRGGVHFLLQVDMQAAITKRIDSIAGDVRQVLRDKDIRHGGVQRQGETLRVRFRDAATRQQGENVLLSTQPDLAITERDEGQDFLLVATVKPAAMQRSQEQAVQQNITTLHNRINELGVAEPVIQQQGADRIVVQLPGVQDVARAKRLIGRTATLEIRMVDEDKMNLEALEAARRGQVPFGDEFYVERNGQPILVKKQVVLTGDRLTDAQPGFDQQTNEPAVHLRLDAQGARIFQDLTRENVNKRMAILLVEKGKGEVVTAPVIRSEIPGGRVQISGRMTTS